MPHWPGKVAWWKKLRGGGGLGSRWCRWNCLKGKSAWLEDSCISIGGFPERRFVGGDHRGAVNGGTFLQRRCGSQSRRLLVIVVKDGPVGGFCPFRRRLWGRNFSFIVLLLSAENRLEKCQAMEVRTQGMSCIEKGTEKTALTLEVGFWEGGFVFGAEGAASCFLAMVEDLV